MPRKAADSVYNPGTGRVNKSNINCLTSSLTIHVIKAVIKMYRKYFLEDKDLGGGLLIM